MVHPYNHYRRVQLEEITVPADLGNVVVLLAQYSAFDFPANVVRSEGKIWLFTSLERSFSLHLCFDLLLRPEDFTRTEYLVDKHYPLPNDGRDDYKPSDPRHATQQIIYQLRQKLGKQFLLCARNWGYRLCPAPGYGYAITRYHLK